jgi:hypothetical protein
MGIKKTEWNPGLFPGQQLSSNGENGGSLKKGIETINIHCIKEGNLNRHI